MFLSNTVYILGKYKGIHSDKLLYLCQFELVLVAGGPGPGHPRQQGCV